MKKGEDFSIKNEKFSLSKWVKGNVNTQNKTEKIVNLFGGSTFDKKKFNESAKKRKVHLNEIDGLSFFIGNDSYPNIHMYARVNEEEMGRAYKNAYGRSLPIHRSLHKSTIKTDMLALETMNIPGTSNYLGTQNIANKIFTQ